MAATRYEGHGDGGTGGGARTEAGLDLAPSQHVYTVTEITRRVKRNLEQSFSALWVVGEATNVSRPRSGHVYFSLKDGQSQLAAVIWRSLARNLRFELRDGLEVLVFGSFSVYEPRGAYQIIVDQIQPKGVGALQLAFLQLKEKLEKEGLFDPAAKQPLPFLPRRIGIVTSPTGAAIRDMLNVIESRFPRVEVLLCPVRVQGEGSAAEIAQAIRELNARGDLDVLIVGRGGGSLEDLWAFNEEVVARAIHASQLPVISAVGHEVDFTIADFVADARALTPTAAGEMVVPSYDDLVDKLDSAEARLRASLKGTVAVARATLAKVASDLHRHSPLQKVRQWEQRLDELQHRIGIASERYVRSQHDKLATLAGKLEALSPLRVLSRGYAISTSLREGKILKSSAEVSPGDRVETRLAQGSFVATVEEVLQ